MTDNRREAEQAVAAAFHQMRADAKQRRKGKPKPETVHPRANTDWWNAVKW